MLHGKDAPGGGSHDLRVEWVGTPQGQQDGIGPRSRSRAEERTHVARIAQAVQHEHQRGICLEAQTRHTRQSERGNDTLRGRGVPHALQYRLGGGEDQAIGGHTLENVRRVGIPLGKLR